MGSEEEPGAAGPEAIQSFIFARELSEVYLLLDYISGRSDKSLTALLKKNSDSEPDWIQRVCEIGWPPTGTAVQKADQAALLLEAKDCLNAAAKPATGATIAFTLLVAGEDNPTRNRTGYPRRSEALHRPATSAGDMPPAAPASPPNDGGGTSRLGSDWGEGPPTRTSLARQAYPGLIVTAARFRLQTRMIIGLLLLWLAFTCLLSWNVAAGHAALARLDALTTQRAAIFQKIANVENNEAKRDSASRTTSVASLTSQASTPAVYRYCDRHRLLPPRKDAADAPLEQFDDVTERQLCDELAENQRSYSISRVDLADWLAIWSGLKGISHLLCNGPCLHDNTEASGMPDGATNEQWAAILAEVLTSAVLPLCYGVLGAGAAVVRDLWSKMRDSLLSPRDLTLALGQLSLGAVIGACIGLFVAPSAAPGGGIGLTNAAALSASALSFIAGFGVEGVFVTMESLIKRVFNISSPERKLPS
jgi:hypothetical protein